MWSLIITGLIFIFTYFLIFTKKTHKTKATLLGAILLIVFGIMDYTEALNYIDFKVIGLVFGMVLLVESIRKSGVLQFIAIKVGKLARGDPKRLLIFFSTLTVLFSSLLSNIPAITIIAPLTLFICEYLEYDPLPYIISEAIMANLGGILTLISSVPNIMIGVEANLSFLDFILNVGFFGLFLTIPTILALLYLFRQDIKQGENDLEELEASEYIENKRQFIGFALIFSGTLFLFSISEFIPLEPELIAVGAGTCALLFNREDTEEVLRRVDWSLLLFFIGLYIVIGGLKSTGLLDRIAKALTPYFNPFSVLFFSTLSSGLVDNIPMTAVLIPIIKEIAKNNIFWWSLVLGVNLGGNLTPIGSPSTVVALDILKEKEEVSFIRYLKWGVVLVLIQAGLSILYLSFLLGLS